MKISRKFNRGGFSSFYRSMDDDEMSVCVPAILHLLGGYTDNKNIVKLTLSTSNPKKKGFRTAHISKYDVTMGNITLDVTHSQQTLFRSLNLEGKKCWLKAEVV